MKKQKPDPKEKPKRLEEYRKTKPRQMTMFEFLEPQDNRYSNTVELYDSIPKYVWGRQRKTRESVPIVRECSHRGEKYKVVIIPATVVKMNADGNKVEDSFVRFPSRREELVEDALRKLACNGHGTYLDSEVSVVFTLHQLKKELERTGHGYNKNEIKEALFICAGTSIELVSEDGEAVVSSHIFQTLALQTQKDWKKKGTKTKAYVRFNPLVTKSINETTFRQLDYKKCMEYKRDLSRYLHKRLSHNYTQAGYGFQGDGRLATYEIHLSTILRDSGFKRYEKLNLNVLQITKSLDELISSAVLSKYESHNIYDHYRKNKIADVKFALYPSPEFIRESKKINRLKKDSMIKAKIEVSLQTAQVSSKKSK